MILLSFRQILKEDFNMNDARTFVIEYIARQNGIPSKNVSDDMIINPDNALHFSMFACANFGKAIAADSTKPLSIREAIDLIGTDSKLLTPKNPISEKAKNFVLQYVANQNKIRIRDVKEGMLINDMDNFYMYACIELGVSILAHELKRISVKDAIEFLSRLM